ncbi:low temperature requirement protein A [Rathayibacter sp. YIM 133350]|uniref:low temperature requirement protein A n=1 Tax=Rathayibacter sp. YIM 133350 TaxID=3131992 RepID=UPI00307E1D14
MGAKGAGRLPWGRPLSVSNEVTTLELFFDLVFVFAFRQVTAIMLADESWLGVVQGLITLGLVWWVWTAYAWLANQARADRGIVYATMVVAVIAMLVGSVAVPEAWNDRMGGVSGPLVFVAAYLALRLVHLVGYLFAAGDDTALRRQLVATLPRAIVPSVALLIVGAVLGGVWQLVLWLAALLLDYLLTYLSNGRSGTNIRVNSVGHLSERYGLVVLLALGESIVSIGAVTAHAPLDGWGVLAVILAAIIAVQLWWAYFRGFQASIGRAFADRVGGARVGIAVAVYGYLHVVIVAGIIVLSVGMEAAATPERAGDALDWFSAAMLGGGSALFLAGTIAAELRASGRWLVARSAAALVAVALIPLLAFTPSVGTLAIMAGLFGAMLSAEAVRSPFGDPAAYAQTDEDDETRR